MFFKVLLSWFSEKVHFVRAIAWFVAGFSFGVRALTLGFVLLAVALVVNFFAHWLELRKLGFSSTENKKPPKVKKSGSDDALQAVLTSYFASALNSNKAED